jgi:hypothetical protein
MSTETLGEAYRFSWRVRVRCVRGHIESPVRIRPCEYQAVLDMQTLVWAKGRNFPIGRLGSRLMCPQCGRVNPFPHPYTRARALMARQWSARCYGVARQRDGSRQNSIGAPACSLSGISGWFSLSLGAWVPKNLARRNMEVWLRRRRRRFRFSDFPVRGGGRDALRYGVSFATTRSQQLAEGPR